MSASLSCVRSRVSACNDIDILPAPDHVEAFQLQAAVRRAFTGLEIVIVAVPRAHEMNFILGETLALPGPVGREHVLDLVHDDAFAGGAALVHAQVLV